MKATFHGRHSSRKTTAGGVVRISRHLVLLLFIPVLFAACGMLAESDSLIKPADGATSVSTGPVDPYEIALVMKTLTNPFFVQMEKGAREAETALGIRLIVKTGAKETSIEQQIQIVEDLIVQQVDAIVIAPGSSTDLVHILKKAQDAGIVIVNIDNRLDEAMCATEGLKDVPFISVRNDEGGKLSTEAICAKAGNKGSAILIEGIRDAENARLRKEGAETAFKANPDITLVASETANWKIDEAYALSKTLLTSHPDVTMAFCANDMMALGLVQYLQETGRKDILVAGFDNLPDAQTAIRDGWMYCTIDQQADVQGRKGVEAAVSLLQKKTVAPVTYVPVKLITKENLAE